MIKILPGEEILTGYFPVSAASNVQIVVSSEEWNKLMELLRIVRSDPMLYTQPKIEEVLIKLEKSE